MEEKKTNDALKKELDSFGKKSKVIDNGLKSAQHDLEAFQVWHRTTDSLVHVYLFWGKKMNELYHYQYNKQQGFKYLNFVLIDKWMLIGIVSVTY